VRATVRKRAEHIELTRARVAVFAEVRVERDDLHAREVDAFLSQKVQRQNARLRRVAAADREPLTVQVRERRDACVRTHHDLRVKVAIGVAHAEDRKSTRLNSSHSQISYAVFCLKKKTETEAPSLDRRTLLSSLSACPFNA